MILGVGAASVFRELIPSCRWCIAAPWAFIAGIDPQPPGLRLAGAGRGHFDGRVIGEDRFALKYVATDGVWQRR